MGRLMAVVLVLLAGCTKEKHFPEYIGDSSYPNGHTLATNTVTQEMAELEAQIVDLTNVERAKVGLGGLLRCAALDALGRGHSAHMMEHDFYGHDNPEGDDPQARAHKTCGKEFAVGENVWKVSINDSAQFIVDGFMGSPHHRDNMLGSYSRIGVGLVRWPQTGQPDLVNVTMEFY